MPVLSWQMATQPLSDNVRKPSFPAGRRCPTPMANSTSRAMTRESSGHRRRGDRPGQQARAAQGAGDAAAATAVAADRRRLIRLCLERLCRHDDAFPAADPPARSHAYGWTGCNGRAVALTIAARQRIVEGGARRARRRTGAAVHRTGAVRGPGLLRQLAPWMLMLYRRRDAQELIKGDRFDCDGRSISSLASLAVEAEQHRTRPISARSVHAPTNPAVSCSRANSPPGIEWISSCVYGCSGCVEHCGGSRLHDFADIHHRDPIADLGGHAQVMGDEDQGQRQPLLAARPAASAPAPAPRHPAPRPARRPPAPPAPAPARGPGRCAGAGRRRIRAESARRRGSRPTSASSFRLRRAPRRATAMHGGPWAIRSAGPAARVERGEGVLEHHLDVPGLAGTRATARGVSGRRADGPAVRSAARTSSARSVDLPEPLSPTMPSVSPAAG